MQFEPWSASVLLHRDVTGRVFGSIGPIPAGVRLRYITVQPESFTTQNIFVAVVLSVGQAKAEADLSSGVPVFGNMPLAIIAGVNGIGLGVFAGIPSERRWQWMPSMTVGSQWLNVLMETTTAAAVTCVFGAVGYRVEKPVEDA